MRLDHLLSKENYLLFNFEGSYFFMQKFMKNLLTNVEGSYKIVFVREMK